MTATKVQENESPTPTSHSNCEVYLRQWVRLNCHTRRVCGHWLDTFAVMKAMGHASVQSMKPYQHQETDQVNEVMNRRNSGPVQASQAS